MESKTINVSQEKMDRVVNIYSHFGWTELSRSYASITLKREKTPRTKKLKSLEKQYLYINRKFPVGGFVTLLIGLVFFVPAIILIGQWKFNFLLFIVGSILTLIGAVLTLGFLFIRPYRASLSKSIIAEADEIEGKTKTLPIEVNRKKGEKHSFNIKKAMYKKEINVGE